MKPVYDNILQTFRAMPTVRLRRLSPDDRIRIWLKIEFCHPLSSIKDRVALAMVEAAENARILTPNSRWVEPSAGNTGISLAMIAAAKGYPLTLIMPESVPKERQELLRILGADLILTPAAEGMRGTLRQTQAFIKKNPGVWSARQFENPANPAFHETTTGPEIYADLNGKIDYFVCAVGTGGTLTGIARFLKPRIPTLKTIAVEPSESAVLSGKRPGEHGILGIGTGFIPKNLDLALLDSVEIISTEEAIAWSDRLAREEGIFGGISTGANIAAAVRLAQRLSNRLSDAKKKSESDFSVSSLANLPHSKISFNSNVSEQNYVKKNLSEQNIDGQGFVGQNTVGENIPVSEENEKKSNIAPNFYVDNDFIDIVTIAPGSRERELGLLSD